MVICKFGSEDEAKILEEFISLVSDLEQDEATCLRFLRARNHDKVKAEEMLRKSVNWKTENKLADSINWTIPKEIQEHFSYGTSGKDKQGRAVLYIPVGRWKTREFIEAGFTEHMDRNSLVQFNYVDTIRRESGHEQMYFILDLTGFDYHNWTYYATIQMTRNLFRDFEENYPEIMYKCAIINAPWIFSTVFPIVKPLLSGHTLSKVSIYNCDAIKWGTALLEDIPPESLPEI